MSEDRKKTSNFQILLSAILVLMIIFTIRSIRELKTSQKKLDDINREISQVLKENTELQEKIIYANSDEFVEKHAVEDLKLTKDGYEIVIVDKNNTHKDVNELDISKLDIDSIDEHSDSIFERLFKVLHLK